MPHCLSEALAHQTKPGADDMVASLVHGPTTAPSAISSADGRTFFVARAVLFARTCQPSLTNESVSVTSNEIQSAKILEISK
jgi:hypothetical protein